MIGVFLVLCMVPTVLGVQNIGEIREGNNLIITEIRVDVDGEDTDLDSPADYGKTIGDEVKPGSNVEIRIEAMNNFTENMDIENIEIEIVIEDIDEGDDLEFDDEFDDLGDGDDDKVKINFDVPLKIDHDDQYKVTIDIKGEDENNTDHEVWFEFYLESKKERNEVMFTRNTLTPSEVKCGRTVCLSTGVINLGRDEEEDVVLEVSNAELGINVKKTFDLSEDPDDDDIEFKDTFTLTLPEDVEAGVYTLQSKVYYDEGGKVETETAELIVAECVVEEEPECEYDSDCRSDEVCEYGECVEEEEEEVVVVQPTVTTTVPTEITGEVVTTPILPTEESVFGTSGFLTALIVGEVLLLIIAILIIVAVFKKKRD